MPDPLTWALGLLGVGAAAKIASRSKATPNAGLDPAHGVLTPARRDFYNRAMRAKLEPEQFERLAQLFDMQGLPNEAKMLRARGNGRKGGKEAIARRREIYHKTFTLRDPLKVERIAQIAREDLGHTETAGHLEEYARGLREAATLGVQHAPSSAGGGIGSMASPRTAVHGETDQPIVQGGGGTLASMGGHSDAHIGFEVKPAGDDCLVQSTGGACTLGGGGGDKEIPPAEVAKVENPFARENSSGVDITGA